MLRKALGVIVVACAIAATVAFGATAATAAPAASRLAATAATDAGIQASPKCSGTESYGPIRYQVCVRYNCDSNSCFHRGYLGVANTATSARTVTWDLDWSLIGAPWRDDDRGVVTLAAGQQKTIYSRYTYETSPCGFTGQRKLTVAYSSGTSAPIAVEDFMACR
ncbi:hypothetical protein [Amycolatopsis sp. WAC 04169]|uniref:hypothetical protein n=1 Tax=Amycolatopsis sp. WAC 04169 TaxID=2203197 RepID=UPI000F7AD40A|nr:hypothetical protein [Amycolatopsis sp. WAC 04169]